ncbi:recombinase family protein [Vibrio sp. H11]|uniref:recombinase family protein n=1 Tax=Vibrio sp. H11 TaxID=2565928 RepID=UPI0010A69894|nr:recombinase family protein [Vibrio sp. H11]
MKYGFVTKDSDLAIQLKSLHDHGCEHIEDTKPIDQVIEQLVSGDELMVWRVDKLAGSVEQLKKVLDRVTAKGASVSLIYENVNSASECQAWLEPLIEIMVTLEKRQPL